MTIPVFIGLAICLLIMFLCWIIQYKSGNAGIVDIAWSFNFGIIALVFYFYADGFPYRKLLLLILILIWSIRLGTHLLIRVLSHFDKEDPRYSVLRNEWKQHLQLKFLLFFLFQGALNVGLSLPFLLSMMDSHDSIRWNESLGVFFWLIAVTGEAIADHQLQIFRNDPVHKGQVCKIGLWRYSRHPNYFFEWMIWIAFSIFISGSPYGYLAWLCPLIMGYFLTRVTGIPLTEELSLKSKGDLYKKYQQETSAFFPWFYKN